MLPKHFQIQISVDPCYEPCVFVSLTLTCCKLDFMYWVILRGGTPKEVIRVKRHPSAGLWGGRMTRDIGKPEPLSLPFSSPPHSRTYTEEGPHEGTVRRKPYAKKTESPQQTLNQLELWPLESKPPEQWENLSVVLVTQRVLFCSGRQMQIHTPRCIYIKV